MAAQLWIESKISWRVHFKRMNFIIYEVYISKDVILIQKALRANYVAVGEEVHHPASR